MHKTKKKKAQTYLTGIPCKRGHISPRYKSNKVCVECTRKIHQPTRTKQYRLMKNTLERQFIERKSKANIENLPFTIKFQDIHQPQYCPILGIKLNYGYGKSNRNTFDPAKATLDKVVPKLGYVPGNVCVISWRANILKSNMTLKELDKIRKYIKENTRGKTIRYK